MSDGEKLSKPRPFSISHDEWSKRWDAIFARDLDDTANQKNEETVNNPKEDHVKDIK